jgi:hypothetical protein
MVFVLANIADSVEYVFLNEDTSTMASRTA